ALSGQVMSADEGTLEGVLVSAKKADSTITITVVSDDHGRYRFPAAKLQPGRYTLRIRAVGYDFDGPREVDVTKNSTGTADLKLTKTHDLAAQLSNSEWLLSFPGTEQQKASIRRCTHCHTLERIALRRGQADIGHRTDVHVSAAFISNEDSEARRRANRRRRRSARAAAGRLAEAGPIPQHSKFKFGGTLELRIQDASASERQSDEGHLHRIRPACEDKAAARRDCRFAGHRVVRELRRANPR